MIRHIVLFNVKEGEDKEQVAAIAAKVPKLLHHR